MKPVSFGYRATNVAAGSCNEIPVRDDPSYFKAPAMSPFPPHTRTSNNEYVTMVGPPLPAQKPQRASNTRGPLRVSSSQQPLFEKAVERITQNSQAYQGCAPQADPNALTARSSLENNIHENLYIELFQKITALSLESERLRFQNFKATQSNALWKKLATLRAEANVEAQATAIEGGKLIQELKEKTIENQKIAREASRVEKELRDALADEQQKNVDLQTRLMQLQADADYMKEQLSSDESKRQNQIQRMEKELLELRSEAQKELQSLAGEARSTEAQKRLLEEKI